MMEEYRTDHFEHSITPVPEAEPEYKSTLSEEDIQAALGDIKNRSYSGRNPHLGKMVNCQVCHLRHRENERKCEQKFTYVVDGMEVFVEDEEGNLVPDYRTCLRPNTKPHIRQHIGAAALHKKRFRPHHNKLDLQLAEVTMFVFNVFGFSHEPADNQTTDEFNTQLRKNLNRSRVIAARLLRKEREFQQRDVRRRQDQSRRINRGLKLGRNRA